jgi:hypothetical protein
MWPVINGVPELAKLVSRGGQDGNHYLLRALRHAECVALRRNGRRRNAEQCRPPIGTRPGRRDLADMGKGASRCAWRATHGETASSRADTSPSSLGPLEHTALTCALREKRKKAETCTADDATD